VLVSVNCFLLSRVSSTFAKTANPPAMVSEGVPVLTGAGGTSPEETVLGIERLKDDSSSIVLRRHNGQREQTGRRGLSDKYMKELRCVNFQACRKIRRS
jgi:hypothetical protein